MTSKLQYLVKVISDIAISLEFTDEMLLNPNVAIDMQKSKLELFSHWIDEGAPGDCWRNISLMLSCSVLTNEYVKVCLRNKK